MFIFDLSLNETYGLTYVQPNNSNKYGFFSYTDRSTIDTFHVSDFGGFGQSYRLGDAVDLSGSKSSSTPTSQS